MSVQVIGNDNSEACGICEKKDGFEGEVFWFCPLSRSAHAKCVKLIEPAEKALWEKIRELFKDDTQNNAHIKAIENVRLACGSDILSFMQKNGEAELKRIFDHIGVYAVIGYSVDLDYKVTLKKIKYNHLYFSKALKDNY